MNTRSSVDIKRCQHNTSSKWVSLNCFLPISVRLTRSKPFPSMLASANLPSFSFKTISNWQHKLINSTENFVKMTLGSKITSTSFNIPVVGQLIHQRIEHSSVAWSSIRYWPSLCHMIKPPDTNKILPHMEGRSHRSSHSPSKDAVYTRIYTHQVVRFFDVGKNTTTDANHPKELVDIITRITH